MPGICGKQCTCGQWVSYDTREMYTNALEEVTAERDRLLEALRDCYLAAANGPDQMTDEALRAHIETTAQRAI